MKALATFLLALTPLLPVTAADSEPACDVANEAVTEEAVLADVMTVYDALPDYSIFFWLEQDEEQLIIKHFQETCDKIRPIIAHLQQLPVEDVKAACLLADSIIYQREWMYGVYLGEFGYECEAPGDTGLRAVSNLFEKVLHYLQPNSGISPATRETLEAFVAACGGVQAMNAVALWEADARSEQDNEREYLAALDFFKDFCAAVSTENEEQCLLQLATLSKQLQQLRGGQNAELLRINYLVLQFRSTLIELWTDVCLSPKPYPNPVLPQALRTETRMQALQPFFEQLPNLRTLVLDRATWQDAEPSAAAPDYFASGDIADEVYGLEVFLNTQGGFRMVRDGQEIDIEDLRIELKEADDVDLFVRLVLEQYADIHSESVQKLVQLCESCGVNNFLFAVRPADSFAITSSGAPCYFVDMVCRISHPYNETWVEYYARKEEPPSSTNTAGSAPLIKIRTPQGNILEYRSQNCYPSVLRITEPWSPCGEYLLLPVSLHSGYLLVRVVDLCSPDFDWSKATPVHALSEWQSAPIYSEPSWEMFDEELQIHFSSGMSGEAKYHRYNIETGELTTEGISSSSETEVQPE